MYNDAVISYIGLGSNLEYPQQQIHQAIDELSGLDRCAVLAQSRLYHSTPMGPQDQPDYINAVVKLATSLDAHELLHALQAIEHAQGRRRDGRHWGPRTLDLDLLLYADQQISSDELEVPHPGIANRVFVLYPLQELDPDLVIQALPGPLSIQDMVADLQRSEVQLFCQPLE